MPIPYPLNRYRPIRVSDGEGGYTETLTPPLVVFGIIEANKLETVAIIEMYEDVKINDLIGVTPEDATAEAIYRVTKITRIMNTTKREITLQRQDRPVSP